MHAGVVVAGLEAADLPLTDLVLGDGEGDLDAVARPQEHHEPGMVVVIVLDDGVIGLHGDVDLVEEVLHVALGSVPLGHHLAAGHELVTDVAVGPPHSRCSVSRTAASPRGLGVHVDVDADALA